MADEEALAQQKSELEEQKKALEAERMAAEAEKRELDEKILRLEEAQQLVKAEKEAIRILKEHIHKQRDPDPKDWDGVQELRYKTFIEGPFRNDYQHYYDEVDTLLDEIIRKTAALQNEASSLTGLLGQIVGGLNSLWGEIRALFN